MRGDLTATEQWRDRVRYWRALAEVQRKNARLTGRPAGEDSDDIAAARGAMIATILGIVAWIALLGGGWLLGRWAGGW